MINKHATFCSHGEKLFVFVFQLFHLPAKKSIETVLEDYANYKKSKGNSDNK